jgi:hypothetical protein
MSISTYPIRDKGMHGGPLGYKPKGSHTADLEIE